MNALYKDGDKWILDGLECNSGIYILGQDGQNVTLLGVQSGERLDALVLVTDISKNAQDDKYESLKEFREATSLFFEKARSYNGYKPIHGQVSGISFIDKFGANELVTTANTPQDVIQTGGIQLLAEWGNAPITVMYTDTEGNNQAIEVSGLDVDGKEVTQIVICNGLNQVVLATPLFRLFTAETNDTTEFIGTVSFGDGVLVYGIITSQNQRTLIGSYTIPIGKVGYLHRGEFGVEVEGNAGSLAEYARFTYVSRRLGKVFTSKKRVTVMVGSGAYTDTRSFPDIIPALTDIKIQVQEVSTNMGVWAAFDIRLVDESKFSQAFLQAIGQP